MKGDELMKQYFIGVNKRSQKLILGLMDLGATLMLYWHPKTIELNNKFKFYDGEWLLVTCVFDDSEIEEIRDFLNSECENDRNLRFEIVYHQ
jgi:hypothetical protein